MSDVIIWKCDDVVASMRYRQVKRLLPRMLFRQQRAAKPSGSLNLALAVLTVLTSLPSSVYSARTGGRRVTTHTVLVTSLYVTPLASALIPFRVTRLHSSYSLKSHGSAYTAIVASSSGRVADKMDEHLIERCIVSEAAGTVGGQVSSIVPGML